MRTALLAASYNGGGTDDSRGGTGPGEGRLLAGIGVGGGGGGGGSGAQHHMYFGAGGGGGGAGGLNAHLAWIKVGAWGRCERSWGVCRGMGGGDVEATYRQRHLPLHGAIAP